MGNTQAAEMSDAVREEQVSLQSAVHYHLSCNHFPPISEYTDLLVDVVQGVNAGAYTMDTLISLGFDTYKMLPARADRDDDGEWTVRVDDFIEATHAWFFIDDLED